ncbi:MAG: O-antigen ligase family protein [Bacteroidota bacterium]
MNQQGPGIAIFDFDGTITDRDSFLAFVRFTHGSWALLIGLLKHTSAVIRYFLRRLPNDEFKEIIFTHFYGGTKKDALQTQAEQFSQTIIPKLVYHGAWEQIRGHQERGDRNVILSASPKLWLSPWCTQHGFELICTEFEVKDQAYTGRLASPNCYGIEKERRILPLLADYPVPQRFGYGDSHSDHHYLLHCGHACYVPLRSALQPFFFRTQVRWSALLYRLLRFTYALLFLLLPFSISFDFGLHQLNIPAEPLLLVAGVLSASWFLLHRQLWPRGFYYKPILLSSLALLAVFEITTIFSTHLLVSIKYTLIATLHWWVLFHSLPLLFDQRPRQLLQLPIRYSLSFFIILGYAWYQHAQYNFRIDVSVLTARPFYFDHALYSCAALLLLGPYLIQSKLSKAVGTRLLYLLGAVLLLVGLYLSFSRAAWLSVLLSTGILACIIVFKLRFKHLLLLGSIFMATLYFGQSLLLEQLQRNETASKTESQSDHFRSALNLTSDVSNLERINRYSCASRMFLDRPHTGFGPGTFQYAYLPYQLPEQMTPISVTEPGRHRPGKGGGAHSEYLQVLSEMGWPGLLTWLVLLGAVFWSALQLYYSSSPPWVPLFGIGLLFSLTTYFTHGLVNNFLHHDKVAALFWAYLAILHYISPSSAK